MEVNILLSKLKAVGQLKHCLSIPKHICKKHLHSLTNQGRHRSGQTWCKYHYDRSFLLNNQKLLAASCVPVCQLQDRLTNQQRRDIYHLHDKNRLLRNRLNHGLLSPSTNALIQHRPYSFTKEILEASPPKMQPYLRLLRFDKPIGK